MAYNSSFPVPRTFTVDDLLKRPFSERTQTERIQIVQAGKPRIALNTSAVVPRNAAGLEGSFFDSKMFDQRQWLTYCEKRQQIYCWPCLLFMHPVTWNKGISDFVLKIVEQHEKSPQHLEAELRLRLFVMNHVKKSHPIVDKIQHNKLVSKNREILSYLIDAICFAINRQAKGCGTHQCNLLKVSDITNFLQLLQHCGSPKYDVVDDAIVLLKESPEIVNSLVDAVTMLLKVAIVKEIFKSTYVSVILSEHVTNDVKSQVSTVLRYVKDGKVQERFVGFHNLTGSKNRHDIMGHHILNIIKGYKIEKKLLALSVDGAILPTAQLTPLIQLIEANSKPFYFVPSQFQGFGRVLLQTVATLEECSLFFKFVNAMESYFEDERNYTAFEKHLCSKVPHLKNNEWYSQAPFVVLLGIYRKHFVEYFDTKLKFPEFTPISDVFKARSFITYLEEIKTVFLLKVFCRMFSNYFDRSFNFFTKTNGQIFVNDIICSFRTNLASLLSEGFADIWISVSVDMIGDNTPQSKKLEILNNPIKNVYENLYQKMLEFTIERTDLLCKDLARLSFGHLLPCSEAGIPDCRNYLIAKLTCEQYSSFDGKILDSEMEVVKDDPLFKNKSVHEIFEGLSENNLACVFPQLYKLCELILTLPYLPAVPPKMNNATKLRCINGFSYIPETTGVPSGEISVLCIEKQLLQDLRASVAFYDEVIAKFSQSNKDMQLKQV